MFDMNHGRRYRARNTKTFVHPAVIPGEREVDEKLIAIGNCRVVLLDNIVDVLKYNTVNGSK